MTFIRMLLSILNEPRPATLNPFMATEADRNRARELEYQARLASCEDPRTRPAELAARGARGIAALAKLQAHWQRRSPPVGVAHLDGAVWIRRGALRGGQ